MIDRRKQQFEMAPNTIQFIEEVEKKGYVVTVYKQNYSVTKMSIKIEKGFVIENFEFDHNVVTPVAYANGLFAQLVEQFRYFNTKRKEHDALHEKN